ncbi:MAG: hypothetical protein ACK5MV_08580 [Aminipila sp.]
MTGMAVNYVLLAITGMYLLQSIYASFKGGVGDRRLFRPIFMGIVFALVLVATIMGIGYMDFKLAIETGNWNILK